MQRAPAVGEEGGLQGLQGHSMAAAHPGDTIVLSLAAPNWIGTCCWKGPSRAEAAVKGFSSCGSSSLLPADGISWAVTVPS